MTSADPFTRASPHWIAAQRGAGSAGAAFSWTGKGAWFRWPWTTRTTAGALQVMGPNR